MIFGGKFDRARKLQQEKMEGRERAYDDDGIGSKLEKGDTAALIISALITFLPVALLTLGVLALVGYLFVMRYGGDGVFLGAGPSFWRKKVPTALNRRMLPIVRLLVSCRAFGAPDPSSKKAAFCAKRSFNP